MLEERFAPREHPKPQLDITDVLAAVQTSIKLRIHRSIMDRLLDYCTDEHFLPDGDDHYIVSIPFIENDYYYSILISFGDRCECLEPLHIRQEIKRRIQRIAAQYER